MSFDSIFITLFVAGWLMCGAVPWIVLSVATRGSAGLGFLPLAMFAGLVAGVAVPVLGMTGAAGLWISFGAAMLVPAGLIAARRVGVGAAGERRSTAIDGPHREGKAR